MSWRPSRRSPDSAETPEGVAASPRFDRLEVDLRAGEVSVTGDGETRSWRLDTPEAFDAVSTAWVRAGWDVKYVYSFTWLGRPVIQLPDDLLRIQEVIWRLQPDLIVETGVAHGGALVFYASLCALLGRGRVVGVDIEIRPHNRSALEAHPLRGLFDLIEGSSTDERVVEEVRDLARDAEVVMVLLDSDHSKAHVRAELEAYGPIVTVGSYIVVMDGIMRELAGAPRSDPTWGWNNPLAAVEAFLADHPEFADEEPEWPFNEGVVQSRVTYWPRAFLRRMR